MSIQIFRGPLTDVFQPTRALTIAGQRITFDFLLEVSALASKVEWYMEFGEDPDPAGDWFRELAQEDPSTGNVAMPKIVRSIEENGGAALAVGVHLVDVEFERKQQFVRLQVRKTIGGATVAATIKAPFGQNVVTAS